MKSKFLHLLNDKLVKLVNLVMQSLKATKRQSDTTIFAESVKVSKFHETFAKSLKSLMSIFSSRGVKDVRLSLGQYPTKIELISNLYLTPNRFFTRFAAVFTLVFVLGVSNVWGANPDPVLCTFPSSGSITNNSITVNSVTWSIETTVGAGSPSVALTNATYASTSKSSIKFGSSKKIYYSSFSLSTNYFSSYNVSAVNVHYALNGGATTTVTATQGNTTIGSDTYSTGQTWHDATMNTSKGTGGELTISFTTTQAIAIHSIEITYTAAASGHSITYHCNGATSGCPSNASGQSALPNPLPTPTRTGCTFAGWYTNEGLTTAATAGATLSANANLYAKWTTNVTLNRNGATETINNVVVGTELDDIDGTGAQGGCSAWTFVGWSKTQRTAQNNSTAMDLVTTVDGPGPYYAVYSHTESGGTTDLSKTETFENQSESTTYNSTKNYNANSSNASIAWTMYYGTVSTNAVLTDSKSAQMRWYSSATSNIPYIATTTPISGLQTLTFNAAVGNTNIKMKVEKSTDGSTWTAVATNITMTTSKDDYSVDINGTIGTNYYIKIGVDGGNSTAPSSGNYTFRVDDVKFDYTASGGSTTYYSTTASCCTSLAQINGSINLSHF